METTTHEYAARLLEDEAREMREDGFELWGDLPKELETIAEQLRQKEGGT